MVWFFLFLMAVYVLALFRAMLLWAKKDQYSAMSPEGLSVTVIVPFRNEAAHLEQLAEALAQQSHEQLEVIWVNDHSADRSVELIQQVTESFPFASRTLHLSSEEGKKAAIALGVAEARGEIILTTDADCLMGPGWVREMIRPFETAEIDLVSGPVELTGKSLFQRWQKMEFATLIALGAGGIRSGRPHMANGANLAYRKSAFKAVNGFADIDQVPSGDDELLLMKMHRANPDGLAFRKAREAVVTTAAMDRWSDFKQQRLRWASKWQVGKRSDTMVIALFIFLLNLSWLLLPLFSYLDWVSPDHLMLIYRIRFIIEAFWVMVVALFFSQAISIRAFLIHQLLYPFYVVYFGLMANLGNYQWKGRSYRVRVQ